MNCTPPSNAATTWAPGFLEEEPPTKIQSFRNSSAYSGNVPAKKNSSSEITSKRSDRRQQDAIDLARHRIDPERVASPGN